VSIAKKVGRLIFEFFGEGGASGTPISFTSAWARFNEEWHANG
jgi:hypothetical protein